MREPRTMGTELLIFDQEMNKVPILISPIRKYTQV